MSGVADADAGTPAGEVQDDTEPTPVVAREPAAAAADDADLDALLTATGADAAVRASADPVAGSGTGDGPAGTAEAAGVTAGPVQEDAAGPVQEDAAGPVQEDAAGPVQEDAAGQARTGPHRPGNPGTAPRAGKAGSPSRVTRKAGAPHATPSGPRPAQGAGTSRRPQAGTVPHAAPAGAPPRPGKPGSALPRPGTAPRRPGATSSPPAPGGTAATPARDRTAPAGGEAKGKRRISRRALIQASLIGGAGVAALPLLSLVGSMSPSNEPLPTNLNFSLNTNWLYGGQYMAGSESSFYDDSGFAPVMLPHTVTPLSWRDWDASAWQQMWIYRRHFTGGPLISSRRPGNRIMVEFDGVMVNATVVINDQTVSTHQGGYLPFSAELTGHVTSGDNLLAVLVDANCLPVPPMSYGRGPASVDFFQPGGIYRDVRLRVLPQAFLSDLFALPVDVLTAQRRVDVECTIDSALPTHADGTLLVELYDEAQLVAAQAMLVSLDTPGVTTMKLSLTGLGDITLWSTDTPKLYTVRATLAFPGVGSHVLSRRIGFRDASFRPDGFYLNGERLQLFGLNRHQLYPYAGMAMPARVQRRDAEILKRELNCNMVRCSHYPQSPHFLDACDELGLLVWEEAPGWHNVDASPGWQDLVVLNVRDMVRRDRSRPSVIIWGTRLNETPDLPGLWAATRQAAAELDGSRPSSGAMAYHQVTGWDEDVFAYNDYTHDLALGEALLRPPFPGLPYLVTEAVGVDEYKPHRFAWTDSPAQLAEQAALHGQAQSLARSEPSYSGLLAWAAFDYASPEGLDPESVKWAGVADGFRVPKPGAAIYQSQVDPGVRPVIVPVFFWELAGIFPVPAPTAMIASNCERLEIFINGAHVTTGRPATGTPQYGHLAYPPFLVHLPARLPRGMPELMIEGYVGSQQVTELLMSSNPARDTLAMSVDDATIVADGSDATRAVFRAVDQYGNLRRYPAGEVTLTLTGPATLIGDNPFAFGGYGGLGAVWIRSLPGQNGTITLAASLPELGQAQVQLRSVPPTRGSQLA
jgi:beta-galactosidase